MNNPLNRTKSRVLDIYDVLLCLYPPRFRREFSDEIRAVFLSRMEAEAAGDRWQAAAAREIAALILSILRERWHEFLTRGERAAAGADGGLLLINTGGPPGARWFLLWTLLTTAAIPAAMITAPMLAALFVSLINLGARAGLWVASTGSSVQAFGYLISLGAMLSIAQGFQLRKFLPAVRGWAAATGIGLVLAGLIGALILQISPVGRDSFALMAALLLQGGLLLGVAQWFYLRRFLSNAFWIILIDTLATGSILAAGPVFTSLLELMVFTLPGAITGLGLCLLLRQVQPALPVPTASPAREEIKRLPRTAWLGIGLVGLVFLFFLCGWVYPASQLTLAKNAGIYPSAEEGMLALMKQGYSSDSEVRIMHAGPNSFDGSSPHIWYVIAEVRAASRSDGSQMSHNGCDAGGSYFLNTREGWVHVSEGSFPEYVGFWMKVNGWAGKGQSTPSTDWAPGQPSRFCQ